MTDSDLSSVPAGAVPVLVLPVCMRWARHVCTYIQSDQHATERSGSLHTTSNFDSCCAAVLSNPSSASDAFILPAFSSPSYINKLLCLCMCAQRRWLCGWRVIWHVLFVEIAAAFLTLCRWMVFDFEVSVQQRCIVDIEPVVQHASFTGRLRCEREFCWNGHFHLTSLLFCYQQQQFVPYWPTAFLRSFWCITFSPCLTVVCLFEL